MGRLVEGKWVVESVNAGNKNGEFVRQDQHFRETVAEGARFTPESERYHLYVSYACPWANRALIFRNLKGLQKHISVSVVSPYMLDYGWSFETDFPGANGDDLYDLPFLKDLYLKADSNFTGKVTVPVLWDKKEQTIVNNESSDIIRIFNHEFNNLTKNYDDYYPLELRDQIDALNQKIYDEFNNGVYKVGFATKQSIYERNFKKLFETIEDLEEHLAGKEYLVGEHLTEADIRFFVTLIRFDAVYYSHFKCNKKRISDYKNLWAYTKRLYAIPEIQETIHMDHIKTHYYGSHKNLNPTGIIPVGPELNLK